MSEMKKDYGKVNDTSIRAEELVLTEDWDKVFPLSDKVNHEKVTFVNHFGITLAADMYEPKDYDGKLPAVAVCGPYSAVKEQVSGLYAQEMAKRGFLAIAFDPSFYGESSGYPRYFNSPDINVEDFQAAIVQLRPLSICVCLIMYRKSEVLYFWYTEKKHIPAISVKTHISC